MILWYHTLVFQHYLCLDHTSAFALMVCREAEVRYGMVHSTTIYRKKKWRRSLYSSTNGKACTYQQSHWELRRLTRVVRPERRGGLLVLEQRRNSSNAATIFLWLVMMRCCCLVTPRMISYRMYHTLGATRQKEDLALSREDASIERSTLSLLCCKALTYHTRVLGDGHRQSPGP